MHFLRLSIIAIAGLVASLCGPVLAQSSYPDKPLRIVSPFAAGGTTDVIARIVAQKLTEGFGQPVIVDPKPGANGIVAAEHVAKSAPDGYTIIIASNGTHGINSSLFAKLPYDPVKDFAPITRLGYTGYLLVVNSTSPVSSVGDLVARAKANPGRHSLAYTASVAQLTGALFMLTTGINMIPVPYKSPTQAFTDLIGGNVDALIEPITSALPQVKGGRLKALAVTSIRRSSLAPDIATFAESGYTGFEVTGSLAFYAPAGTPKDIIAKLHSGLSSVLTSPDTKEKLLQVGWEVALTSPTELAEALNAEIATWARVFKEANLPKAQ